MRKLSLVGRKIYQYNDDITVNIPTVGQVRGTTGRKDDEIIFWNEVNLFTRTPSDMISELDSMGMDFEELTDYSLFTIMYMINKESNKSKKSEKSFLFKEFSLSQLNLITVDTGLVFVDNNGKMIINEEIFNDLSEVICTIAGREKTKKKKFGNAYAKKKRIEQDYKNKAKARKDIDKDSNMIDAIVMRLVCDGNFPYDFETIDKITIYDLIHSLKQIDKNIQVSDLMQSRLVGNDLTKLPPEQLSRFIF